MFTTNIKTNYLRLVFSRHFFAVYNAAWPPHWRRRQHGFQLVGGIQVATIRWQDRRSVRSGGDFGTGTLRRRQIGATCIHRRKGSR